MHTEASNYGELKMSDAQQQAIVEGGMHFN